MPAFTFEKIAPPVRTGPLPTVEQKQRGVVTKILDRFVETRVARDADKNRKTAAQPPRR